VAPQRHPLAIAADQGRCKLVPTGKVILTYDYREAKFIILPEGRLSKKQSKPVGFRLKAFLDNRYAVK
jgi:hypothetical protein